MGKTLQGPASSKPTACSSARSRLLQPGDRSCLGALRAWHHLCRCPSPAGRVPPRKENGPACVCVCVSPLSGPPKISALLGTCELEIHISVTGQERGIGVESWGIKWHPQPSLGAACTTREQLPPKSWFVWAMGQPYYPQAAGSVQLVEDGREGRGHKPMPQGRNTARGTRQEWRPSAATPVPLLPSPHSSFLRPYLIIQKKLGNLLLCREQQAAPQGSLK